MSDLTKQRGSIKPFMSEQLDLLDLVKRAQRGDKEALNRLAELSVTRLRVYVYRLTLQEDLTSEIVQETLLEMVKILGNLKNTDRFFPWLYGIATNKLRHYYRSEVASRKAIEKKSSKDLPPHKRKEGLENLLNQELKEIVTSAIQGLKTRHRAVLIMRCYDGMSYAEIAESLGCSEFGTRMLFLRAKKALQKQLSKSGLGKGSLLAVLTLFGKMTAPSEAAATQITVTAATANVGLAASLAGLATGKAAVLSVVAAGALSGGIALDPLDMIHPPVNDAIVAQTNHTQVMSYMGQDQPAIEKSWYYMPDGPGGPLMMRVQGDTETVKPDWIVLQNDYGNYYFDGHTVTLSNSRYRNWAKDLSVLRLPTDSVAMKVFLSEVEGTSVSVPTVTSMGNGLLVSVVRDNNENNGYTRIEHNPNVAGEDFFQSDWPTYAERIDNRDAMHQRGWTYFTIQGHIKGKIVSGEGRIPFVYRTCKKYSPWLKLRMDDMVIMDKITYAMAQNQRLHHTTIYRAGSFFKGLSRPWMGLHSLDTVRRDAAELRIPFSTELSPDGKQAQVEMTIDTTRLLYTVDMEGDIVKRIDFIHNGKEAGMLVFDYMNNINDRIGSHFVEPKVYRSHADYNQNHPGLQWLVQLMENSLVQ